MSHDRLTHKQNRFAILVAGGSSLSDAYKEAYDAENMGENAIYVKASNLAKQGKVGNKIEQLRKDAAEAEGITVEGSLAELNRLKQLAIEGGNFGAAVRTEELRGKVAGIYVERHEELGQQMSDEDLAKGIAGDDEGAAYEIALAMARGEPMDAQRIAAITARYLGGVKEVDNG